MLEAGQILPTDFFWQEGMSSWEPVEAKFHNQPKPTAPTPTSAPPKLKIESKTPERAPNRCWIVYALSGAIAVTLSVALYLFINQTGEEVSTDSAPSPSESPTPLAARNSLPEAEPTPAEQQVETTPGPPRVEEPPSSDASENVSIVAWNLEWYPGGRPEPSVEGALLHEMVAKSELAKIDPDVFLAQEIRSWADFERLASSLPGLQTAVVSAFLRGSKPANQQLAIASRLPVNCAWAEMWKPATPAPPRGFSAAVLEVPDSDKLLLVYSVHLKSNVRSSTEKAKNYSMREESARQLLDHVRDMELLFEGRISGIVIGGDFNTNHDGRIGDTTISIMIAGGFHNTWSGVAAEDRHTWRGSDRFPPTTFDYIFTKGIAPLTAHVIDAQASDHRPVELSVPLSELRD